jgi:predicted RND superfamily exporter protein
LHSLSCFIFKPKANRNSFSGGFVEKIAKFIVEKRIYFLWGFIAATILGIYFAQAVRVNYDLTKYLPQDMPTSESLTLMEEEFGINGLAQFMAVDVSIPQALALKEDIKRVTGVESVLWLDDFIDIAKPLELADRQLVENYYKDGNVLISIVFSEGDHSLKTGEAIAAIENLRGANTALRGPAVEAYRTRQTASSEVLMITLFVLPIFLIILLFSTGSWIEPVIFIATIGISILINMGTNIFIGEVSYITNASSGLLQFAVTMDYSIFLLHRFGEERAKGHETKQAMINALKLSFSAVSASSMTTVAGFAALMFMRYGIGFDMGIVLAKGVILSLITVMILLPALIILFEKTIERTHHRPFMPDLKKFARGIMKLKIVIPVIALILPVAFLAQNSNHFLYGDGVVSEKSVIYETFGEYNPLALLVPSGDIQKEAAMARSLEALENVSGIESLAVIAGNGLPREFLPQALRDNFETDEFSRMVIYIDAPAESDKSFAVLDDIREIADKFYHGQYFLVGSTSAVSDIRKVVEHDFSITNMIAILAVGAIVLLTFRSISIPVILVLVIQTSIWINMSIPYFTGSPLIFIGYMIVSAVQLGATIDYAILLTGRYMECRRTANPLEAAVSAIADSGNSVITSAAIMSAAGFTLGYISGVPGIASLGMLLGRGALLSCALVLTVLPNLLAAADGLIRRTTLKHGFLK